MLSYNNHVKAITELLLTCKISPVSPNKKDTRNMDVPLDSCAESIPPVLLK